MLPAPGLLTACSQEDSRDVSLFAQGIAVTNVDVSLSPGSKHCNGTTAAVSYGCDDAATVFPLHRQSISVVSVLGLHVACLLVEALYLIVALCSLG